jgi:hypothetical protein
MTVTAMKIRSFMRKRSWVTETMAAGSFDADGSRGNFRPASREEPST